MPNDKIRRAARSFRRLVDTRERKRIRYDALLGDAQGTVAVPGFSQLVYARLLSDTSRRIRVRDTIGLSLQSAGRLIEVEAVLSGENIVGWVALGYSLNVSYPSDPSAGPVALHDHPAGNVGVRAITMLRAAAQSVADLTLQVYAGWYFLDTWIYTGGGNSPAFVPPVSGIRYDALCIDASRVLSIVTNVASVSSGPGGFPASIAISGIPVDVILLALVKLSAGQTSITETSIIDGRAFLTRQTLATLTHNLLSATHPDTLAASPTAGDLIVANSTPKWARLAKGTGTQLLKMVSGVVTWALAALSELSDVTLTTPTNNDVLTYETSSGKWKNKPATGGSGSIEADEDGSTVDAAATILNFTHGLDVTSSPSGTANVAVDESELSHGSLGSVTANQHHNQAHILGTGGDHSDAPTNQANGFVKRNAANAAWEEVPYGTASNTVTQGNDSRLSDARTPTAHASTHQHSGGDEVATATPGASVIPKAGAGGKLAAGFIPDFVASGASHASGGVPDPGAVSGTTHYLREDGTWATPGGTGGTVVGSDAIWDAKGDLAAGTSADAASRVPVGANGTVLTADSTQTTGVKWDTAGAPSTADYWVETADAGLSAEVVVGTTGITTAAEASKQAAAKAGRLFFPNNGMSIQRDTGSAWVGWGPVFPLTDPALLSFAWINQGTANVSTTNGGVILTSVANQQLRIRKKAIPSTPYHVIFAVIPGGDALAKTADGLVGVVWRNSSSGNCHAVEIFQQSGTPGVNVTRWSSPTVFVSNDLTLLAASFAFVLGSPVYWIRIGDDGSANRTVDLSSDGVQWANVYTAARTTYITPDEYGFFVSGNSANTLTASVWVMSIQETG